MHASSALCHEFLTPPFFYANMLPGYAIITLISQPFSLIRYYWQPRHWALAAIFSLISYAISQPLAIMIRLRHWFSFSELLPLILITGYAPLMIRHWWLAITIIDTVDISHSCTFSLFSIAAIAYAEYWHCIWAYRHFQPLTLAIALAIWLAT